MAERDGFGSSLMDNNRSPNFSDRELEAALELEAPEAMAVIEMEAPDEIEIRSLDDGGVEIDFDPNDSAEGEPGAFSENLAEVMDEIDLARLSSDLVEQFESNRDSRSDWSEAYRKGLDLLGFKYEEKTQPFEGASGVTHPLLAEAATQFQAQAFNELLPPSGPVRTYVVGKKTPEKVAQASRVKTFMNYYITNRMEEYTPDMDQLLFHLPLAGSAFKKTYYDDTLGRAVSKFVPAEDLVVPYETTDLETCPIITQVVKMTSNELKKRQLSGMYRDIEVVPGQVDTTKIEDAYNEIEGVEPSILDYDCTLLEFHVELDLPGYEDRDENGEETGLKLPYVVTISKENGEVLAIRRNYREGDEKKTKVAYFTHFKFLPGFGFYGLGLIHTIGGLSRTATAALRQLIDAGTLSNLPSGFKARGLRIIDNDEPIQPGEFRDVDAPGGAIRDSLMPLPFKGPDQTLFNLLGFVVEAGQRFATITDLKVGDGNQQAPVGTTIAMMEQGSRVMSAVHKRLHYAMRQEFKILARVIADSLPDEYPYSVEGADRSIKVEDFDDRVDVVPVSNPNVFSQAQRIVLAQTKMQLAAQAPELHNMHEIFRDMYEALGVTDTDRIMKSAPASSPRPLDPAQENINALDQLELKAFEGQDHQAHIMAHLTFAASPMIAQMPPIAMIIQKHVMDHVRVAAREEVAKRYLQGLQQTGEEAMTEVQMLEIERMTSQLIAEGMTQVRSLSQQIVTGGQQAGPDPLIQLKQQEMQQDAQEAQADQELERTKLELQAQNQAMRGEQFQQRLASQERQTQARIQAAMDRERLKMRQQ